MGYYVQQVECSFFMPASMKDKALALLREMDSETRDSIKYDTTIESALYSLGFRTRTDENGNIDWLYRPSGKIGNDWEIMQVIAPTVQAGSFRQIAGDDGVVWRWLFKYGKCVQIYPTWETV